MESLIILIKRDYKSLENEFRFFFKWLIVSLTIGIIGGIVGSLFYVTITKVTSIREMNPWLIYFLPVGGLVIAAIYKLTPAEGKNTDTIITSILKGNNVPMSLTPAIFVSTAITHLLGGSAGREGAALQIGGSIGCNVGRLYRLDEKEERLAILSGMSAVFSALFGTPTTAVIFALEVCSVGIIHYSGLIPCGIASITAFYITKMFGIAAERFVIEAMAFDTVLLIKIAVLSILCALLSMLLCKTFHLINLYFPIWVKNPFLRIAAGGAVIIGLTLLVGNQNYNGGGMNIIATAIEEGKTPTFAFALKLLFTAITLACGFKGGEIVPTFFIGATFGCVIGPLLGIPAGMAAAIGLVALFCGAVNCPLASLVLSVELFGSANIIYFAVACFVAYMLSGYTSLYSEQKIIYSKYKAEYINRKTD